MAKFVQLRPLDGLFGLTLGWRAYVSNHKNECASPHIPNCMFSQAFPNAIYIPIVNLGYHIVWNLQDRDLCIGIGISSSPLK